MATPFDAGMFTTPEQIRSNRLNALRQQNTQRMSMPLLNQVAAGRGDMMSEGIAGLFGLKSPEEQQAAQIQTMMKSLQDTNDPNAYSLVAKKLNDMGYTREAMAVMQQRGVMMNQRNTEFAYQNQTRPMSVTVPDYKVITDPLTGQQQLVQAGVKSHTFTQTYNHQTKQWEPTEAQAKAAYAARAKEGGTSTGTASDGKIKIGLTANPDPTNQNAPKPTDLTTLNPDVIWDDMMPAQRANLQKLYQTYLQTTKDNPPKTFKEFIVYDHIMTHGQPDTNIQVMTEKDGRTQRQRQRYQR